MFNKKDTAKIKELEKLLAEKDAAILSLKTANNDFARMAIKKDPSMADLMRDSLGLPMLNFHDVDEDGKPPHFLSTLTPEERANWVASLSGYYLDTKFSAVLDYIINLFGNHALQKASDENMRNGRIAIVAIRTLKKEFSDAYAEHLASKKSVEEFDEHEVLPT